MAVIFGTPSGCSLGHVMMHVIQKKNSVENFPVINKAGCHAAIFAASSSFKQELNLDETITFK